MLKVQRVEDQLVSIVRELVIEQQPPMQSDDAVFLELAILNEVKKIAEARYKGLQKQLVKDKKLRNLEKDKCTENTSLYDGATVQMYVEVGTPRTRFDKEKMVTQLQLRGVSKSVIDTCMADAEGTTAAPQSVKFMFK